MNWENQVMCLLLACLIGIYFSRQFLTLRILTLGFSQPSAAMASSLGRAKRLTSRFGALKVITRYGGSKDHRGFVSGCQLVGLTRFYPS